MNNELKDVMTKQWNSYIRNKNDITLFKQYDFVYLNDAFTFIYQTLIY